MTPVQLPEVPEWSGEFMTESEFREAARAYATEAVRQHCERIARKIRARADEPGTEQHHGTQYVYGLRNAANTVDSLTPSEPNSETQ